MALSLFGRAQCSEITISSDLDYSCAPSKIKFTLNGLDSSKGVVWDLGKGSIYGNDTIYEFYLKPQSIYPKATITLPNDQKCIVKSSSAVEILPKPDPEFVVSRTKLCDGPDSVSFKNLTPNTSRISWVIDGTNYFDASNEQIHHFKTVGSKNISLVVLDSFGCRGIAEFEDVVQVYNDVSVNISASNTSGCVPQVVKFLTKIVDNGEKIVSYQWLLEGATTPFSNLPKLDSALYLNSGSFDVRLKLETDRGCIHDFNKEDFLQFGDTLPIVLDISDSTLCTGDFVEIYAADLPTSAIKWTTPDADVESELDNRIILSYPKTGAFDIAASYLFNQCQSKIHLSEIIQVKEVVADFSSQDYFHCKVPHMVHLENRSRSSDSGQIQYEWRYYQDKNLIAAKNQVNDSIYISEMGLWDVELIVKHQNGCVDTIRRDKAIRVDSMRGDFSVLPPIACIDQTIEINSNTPQSSYVSKDSFYWIFYDKDKSSILSQKFGNSTTISYRDTGKYDIELIAANSIGCADTIRKIDAVEIIIPDIDFSVSNPRICIGESFEFKGTTAPNRANFRHFWSIHHEAERSGSIEFEGNTHLFKPNRPGNYFIKYAHQIHNGCRDSLESPDLLKVNGIDARIDLDTFSGCLPFRVSPVAAINYNFHVGHESDTLSYEWSATPSIGIEISDPYAVEPQFVFTNKGSYKIQLKLTNSTNCKIVRESVIIYAGVTAAIHAPNDKVCVGGTISLKNHSKLLPTKTEWKVFSNGRFDASTKNNLDLTPLSRGNYRIRLIASKKDQCFDTANTIVNAVDVKGDFNISDTQLYCAPAYAQFQAIAQDADTFIWDFGDGNSIKTTDSGIANIYQRNSGWHDGFDIRMISKNALGCSDTALKKDALKVIGPVPKFSMSNQKGCEPLTVNLINESTDAHRFFMNYNDASPLDSSFAGHHQYKRIVLSDSQVFNPSLYAIDSLGCAAVFVPSDSVLVYRTSRAVITTNDTIVCVPQTVNLSDGLSETLKRNWYVNSQFLDTVRVISIAFSEEENAKIQLTVQNEYGCMDTAKKSLSAHVPAKFRLFHENLPCQFEGFQIETIEENTAINFWDWKIDGVSLYTQPSSIEHTFTSPGNHSITVETTDINACRSKEELIVNIPDPLAIPRAEIEYVSFNTQNDIELYWKKSNYADLKFVRGYELPNNLSIFDLPILSSEFTHEVNSVQEVGCYKLQFVDRCMNEGLAKAEHCPVKLQLTSKSDFSISLNWTPYEGWDEVSYYTVYRISPEGELNEIAKLDSDTYSYMDTWLCSQEYGYVVSAHNQDYISYSNRAKHTPKYRGISEKIPVDLATVSGNEFIEVLWGRSSDNSFREYELSIYDLTERKLLDKIILDAQRYVHLECDIHQKRYRYEIRSINHCNDQSAVGLPGGNILLTSNYIDHRAELTWSSYELWENGIERYAIELMVDGAFKEIESVQGNITTFVDKHARPEVRGVREYRIRAYSNNQPQMVSTSNIANVIGPSEVYIPNAFSPNRDGLNDEFKPYGRFVDFLSKSGINAYRMTIYNRWGEKLFETSDTEKGWDGQYRNESVQAGSYLYHIHLVGLDRKIYELKGQLNLIK